VTVYFTSGYLNDSQETPQGRIVIIY